MKKRIFSFLVCVVILVSVNCIYVAADTLSVSAKSAVVINADTGTILYEKNCYEKLPMASTTKIMTALLLAEQENLDTLVVTTKQMVTVEGSSMGLLEGDTVSYRDLLYGMMLPSGNDAANTTAIALAGSIDDFVDLMNKKAQQLGLESTHFVTPSGLDANDHYTTAYDLAKLAAYAMKNENFKKAASSETATLYYGNPPYRRTLSNHNKLLNMYDGTIGVKTGYTKKSGRCLVSAAERDGVNIIAVTLNDPDDWSDHTKLLDVGFSKTKIRNLSECFKDTQINVVGSDFKSVDIASKDCFAGLTDAEYSNITYTLNTDKFIYAPVQNAAEVGSVNYYLNDILIATAPVITCSEAPKFSAHKKTFLRNVFDTVIYLLKDL